MSLQSCGRCGAIRKDRQIGLEDTPGQYVESIVGVFREVRRVLRDDGTIWLNLGDSYFGGGYSNHTINSDEWKEDMNGDKRRSRQQDLKHANPSMKPKDMVLIPERVSLALQSDGWWIRSAIPWIKRNTMPGSTADRPIVSHETWFLLAKSHRYYYDRDAVRSPLLPSSVERERSGYKRAFRTQFLGSPTDKRHVDGKAMEQISDPAGRSRRTGDAYFDSLDEMIEEQRDWLAHLEHVRAKGGMLVDPEGEPLALDYATARFPGSHFATFPRRMIDPLIRIGTSDHGACPACGAPWIRIVERPKRPRKGQVKPSDRDGGLTAEDGLERVGMSHFKYDEWLRDNPPKTVGWEPGCGCNAGEPVPCRVLDPFGGACTTPLVAQALGRIGIGLDLNPDYLAMGRRRIERPHAATAKPTHAETDPGDEFPLFMGRDPG